MPDTLQRSTAFPLASPSSSLADEDAFYAAYGGSGACLLFRIVSLVGALGPMQRWRMTTTAARPKPHWRLRQKQHGPT